MADDTPLAYNPHRQRTIWDSALFAEQRNALASLGAVLSCDQENALTWVLARNPRGGQPTWQPHVWVIRIKRLKPDESEFLVYYSFNHDEVTLEGIITANSPDLR